jgi:hypothetical protein
MVPHGYYLYGAIRCLDFIIVQLGISGNGATKAELDEQLAT